MASTQPVWHLARLSFSGRPGRSILVAFAVGIASALVVTISCAIETAVESVRSRMEILIGEADARVVHRHGVTFEPTILDELKSWSGVEAVGGRVAGALAVERVDGPHGRDGRLLHTTLRCRGTDLDADAKFKQVEYVEGRAPLAEGEIGLDPAAAKVLQAGPGTRLRVLRLGDPVDLIVTGLYKRAMLGALQNPSAHISRHTLVTAADADDGVTTISIALAPDVDAPNWVEANRGRVSAPLLLETTEMATSGLDRPARAGGYLEALATMLAFLCCSLLVATAMATALEQQQRELALLRCIGASRKQIFAGQVIAGAALCLAAGAIGVPIGLGLARVVAWWYSAQLPEGMTISWRGVSLALLGSLTAGTLGALWPAWRASRVNVLKALAPHARATGSMPIWIAGAVGAGCILVQLALLEIPDPERRFWTYVGIGLPLIHLGWFLLAIPLVATIARLIGSALEGALNLPRSLLVATIRPARWRLGLVAGALMIGVTLLVATWTSGNAILSDVTERVRFGDAFAFKPTGFTRAEIERIRAIEGVDHFAAIGYLPVEVISERVFGLQGLSTSGVVCIGFESKPFLAMNRLDFAAGDPEHAAKRLLDGDAILVAREFMTARGIGPGSRLELGAASHHANFEVVGVVGAAGLDVATQFFGIRSLYMEHALSCVFMDLAAVEKHFGSREAFMVQIALPESATTEDETRIEKAIEAAAPGAAFASGRSIRNEVLAIGRVVMAISTTIAVGALLLASLACASVIAAGVAARTREFGVLEAVGADRSTLLRMVAGEAIVVGLAAGLIGNAFGWHVAWMESRIYHDLAGLELNPTPHYWVGIAGAGLVMLAALLASLPAMRIVTRRSPRELLGTAAA